MQKPAPTQPAALWGRYLDSGQHCLGDAWLTTNRGGFPFGERRDAVRVGSDALPRCPLHSCASGSSLSPGTTQKYPF